MSDSERPEWFTDWLARDQHVPADEPVEVGEAERRLARRGRILDWAQIAALVVPVVMSVVAVAIMLEVLSVAHRVDGRASSVAANNGKLAATVAAQAADEQQLKAIAAALGRLETARTEDEKLDALNALRAASAAANTPATTTTVPARRGGTAPATTAPSTTAPATSAPPPTTPQTTARGPGPTTTTSAPRPPPPFPCLLPRSAICPTAP